MEAAGPRKNRKPNNKHSHGNLMNTQSGSMLSKDYRSPEAQKPLLLSTTYPTTGVRKTTTKPVLPLPAPSKEKALKA
jgi:hypothetical protein